MTVSPTQTSLSHDYMKNEWLIGDFVRYEAPFENAQIAKTPDSAPTEAEVWILVRTQFLRHRLLRRCLNSIFDQDIAPSVTVRVLILHHADCDPAPFETYCTSQPLPERQNIRLTYVPCQDGHRSSLLNAGLEHATSGAIAVLDDDDYLFPSHLRTLLPYVSEPEVGAAYAASDILYTEGGEDGAQETQSGLVHYALWWSDRKLLRSNLFPIQSVIFRRDSVAELRFTTELDAMEDWHFWIGLSERTRFKGVPRRTSAYRTPKPGGRFWKDRVAHHLSYENSFSALRKDSVSAAMSRPELADLKLMDGVS